MKVDNRLQTAKLKMGYMIMLAVIFSLTAYFTFEEEESVTLPTVILLIIFVYIVLLFRRSNYFFFEYIGNKITVRYYSAHPFFRNYKAFEIPKSYFAGYQIKKSLLGLRETIQFIVQTPKGKFMYPPLSIILLSNNQKNELLRIMEEIEASQAL